jgi:hypothetical protein
MPTPPWILATHLALAFGPGADVPPAVVTAAVAEAAAIWSPYGVVVERAAPSGRATGDAVVLTVVFGSSPSTQSRPATPQGPLGAIDFAADGTPGRVLTVFFDLLMRFVSRASLMAVTEDRWPQSMRDLVVGRAMGRVVAHEIGHYLFDARQHTPMGLMRAEHRADDLFSPSRAPFTLSAGDARRLQAYKRKGPAHMAGPE